jgi:hypothetical protein
MVIVAIVGLLFLKLPELPPWLVLVSTAAISLVLTYLLALTAAVFGVYWHGGGRCS